MKQSNNKNEMKNNIKAVSKNSTDDIMKLIADCEKGKIKKTDLKDFIQDLVERKMTKIANDQVELMRESVQNIMRMQFID